MRSFLVSAAIRFVLAIALVLALLVLMTLLFPVDQWLGQRDELDRARIELDELRAENAELEARRARLDSDTEIERTARELYNLVGRDEEVYAVLPPGSD